MSGYDSEPEEVLIGDDEILYGVGSNRVLPAPEKRLSSPITIGLLQRLIDYTTRFSLVPSVGSDGPAITCINHIVSRVQSDPSLNYSNILPPLRQFLNVVTKIGVMPEILDAFSYPRLMQYHDERETHIDTDIGLASKIHGQVTDAYLEWIRDVLKPAEFERAKKRLRSVYRPSPQLYKSAKVSAYWSRVVDHYRRQDRTLNYPRIASTELMEIASCTDYVIFRVKHEDDSRCWGKWKCATYEQLQMIQDATLSRHNTYAALAMSLHNGTDSLKDQVTTLLNWHDYCLELYGNDGYELIKAPEALYKTYITKMTSGDVLEYSAYDRAVDKLKVKERQLNTLTPAVDRLLTVIQACTTIGDAVELFGLIKLSGHPSVYADKSAASVRTEALPRDPSRPLMVIRMVRMFKHMILSAYIARHNGEWPTLRQLPGIGTQLKRHFNNRATTLPLYSYPLSDLDELQFGKFIDFDYSEDFLKFLDDKSISVGAEKLWTFWWPAAERPNRRLLLEALATEKINMVELVERMRRGQTTRNEEIIELTQKERELKNAARCFCKMVLAIRCFFVLTEYNLGEYLMTDYLPQQTMTMSDSATKTRLYNMAFRATDKNCIIEEVDFSRWNLRWRRSSVDSIAYVCEDIFGLPGVFSQFHRFCTRSTIVLTDKHSLPLGAMPQTSAHSWPEGDLVWRNRHLGGFEGIQQKLWTICTLVMLYLVFQGLSCSFLMAGQGDNQIFVLKFPPGTCNKANLISFLARLEMVCKQVNQEVKPEECIDSSTVLTYSKEIYVSGVHYQYSLKFLSRTMAVHDSDIPSFSAEVSSVSSAALMVANTLPIPLQGHWWQTFRMIRMMREHARFSDNKDISLLLEKIFKNPGLLRFILLLPGSLGGLPVMSWGRFLIRGEVDELSWDIASTLRLKNVEPLLADFNLLLVKRYTSHRPDLISLLQDPMSIPLRRPADQTRLIREHLEKKLPQLTKNTWIYEIISNHTGRASTELAKALCSTTPFYPVIMADIFQQTLPGLRQDMYGRFNMTRTIASAVGGLSFAREISTASATLLAWIITRYNTARTDVSLSPLYPERTFEYACRLRSFWGVSTGEQLGTTYVPLASVPTNCIPGSPGITAYSRTPICEFMTTTGPYPPNFGTKTKQKVSQHGYKIVSSSDTVKALRGLVITCSQIAAGPRLRQTIDRIIRSRSPWSLEMLEPIFPTVYGGVAAHRHEKIRNKLFGIMGNQTPPTHIGLSSDNTGPLSGGQEDYSIVFQEFYLSAINIAQTVAHFVTDSTRLFALKFPIPDLQPLPIDHVEAAIEPNECGTVSPDNKLAYVTKLQIKILTKAPPSSVIPPRAHFGSPALLVASYLLNKHNVKTDMTVNPDGLVTQPIEWFDIAEINNLTLEEIIRGMAIACCIESTYHILRLGYPLQVITKHSVLYYIARCYTGGIARTLLLPDSPHRSTLQNEGMYPPFGANGPLYLTKRVAGKVANLAERFLTSGYIPTLNYPFIVFGDTSGSGIALIRKLSCFYLTYAMSKDSSRLSFPKGLRQTVFDSFFIARDTADAMQSVQYGLQLVTTSLTALSMSPSRSVSHRATLGLTTWPPVVWDKRDADEAKRDLRANQIQTLPVTPELSVKITRTHHTGHMLVSSTSLHVDSYVTADLTTYGSGPRMPEWAQALSFLFRTEGRLSSALSIWHRVLAPFQDIIQASNVLSVGVGNGAVAESCNRYGAAKIIGWDLRTAFPVITQREVGFVPGELTGQNKFDWSPFIFTEGGDWLTAPHDRVLKFHDIDIVIIDIETEASAVLQIPLVPSFTGLCLIRTFLNTTEVEMLYSTGIIHEARSLASVSPLDGVTTFPVLLKMNVLNWNNKCHVTTNHVKITHIAPLRSYLPRNRDMFLSRLADSFATLGIEFKTGSTEEIDEKLLTVRRMQHNTPHVTMWAKIDSACEVLDLFQRARHMTHDSASTLITSQPYRIQRALYLLFANYWPDTDAYANHLVHDKLGVA